jgi:hypothetical protein
MVRHRFGVCSQAQRQAEKSFTIFNLRLINFRGAPSVSPQVPGSSPGRGANVFKHLAQPTKLGFLLSASMYAQRRTFCRVEIGLPWLYTAARLDIDRE